MLASRPHPATTAYKGLLALVLVLAVLVSLDARGQEAAIAEIRVEGSERIADETVRSYLDVRVGDSFAALDADAALQRLYDTGLFRDVALYRSDDTLIVEVRESPIINRIAFEGNEAVDNEQLRQEVSLRARETYQPADVQREVRTLRRIYRRQGYFSASITPQIIRRDQNRVDLVFEIDEGPETKVRGISFVGNDAYSDRRLRDVIETKEARWWRFLSPTDTYDPDRLGFDEEQLRRFYLDRGYADFQVDATHAGFESGRSEFYVTFRVDEGPRYRIGEISLDSALPQLADAGLLNSVTFEEGDWFSASAIDDTVQAIDEAIAERDVAFVDVVPQLARSPEDREIDVTFELREGRRAVVGDVRIIGNTRTRDYVIRREMELAAGDPFTQTRLRRSQRQIRQLGFFSDVSVDVAEDRTTNRVDITVEVTERATGELSLGAGYSTGTGGLLEFSISEQNFLGRGQELRLDTTLSLGSTEFRLGFTEPYFLGRDLEAGFDLRHERQDAGGGSSYSLRTTGITLRMGYPLGRNLRQRLTYRLEERRVNDTEDASRLIQAQEGQTLTSAIGQTLTWDRRDQPNWPTEGDRLRIENELAGLGGDRRNLRSEVDYRRYYPFAGGDVVLEVGGAAGYIFGIFQDVRIDERFFVGPDRVRGFASRGIGPRAGSDSSDDSLGGNAFASAGTELFLPTPVPDDQVRGRAFLDAATLTEVDESDADIQDTGSVRSSYGFGLTWRSPIGPIQLDWGWPITREPYDRTQVFRLDFGARL